ncbi:MAG: PIN domain-containing protein [Cyanobacteria bacterium]|nr:PIN domain-containing protein [Cyanobacteriota bacterium]
MIAVDTSIWIRALRSAGGPEAIVLRSLLDADEVALPVVVRSELLMGAKTADRKKLIKALKSVPLLYPSDESWRTIDEWTATASRAGAAFTVGDLLIGVLTQEIGGLVWSADSDFARMESLNLVGRFSA